MRSLRRWSAPVPKYQRVQAYLSETLPLPMADTDNRRGQHFQTWGVRSICLFCASSRRLRGGKLNLYLTARLDTDARRLTSVLSSSPLRQRP